MSHFTISKKFSVPLNFPNPFSPILHESFKIKNKTGETGKDGDLLSAGDCGVPPSYFGFPSHVSAVQPVVRRSTYFGKCLLKTGNQGGKLRSLRREIVRGQKTMKNFHLRVQSTLDNKNFFKSIASPRKVAAKQAVQMLSKQEQED